MSLDLEAFGTAVGKTIRTSLEPLEISLAVLEKKVEGMQGKLDKCAQFAGAFEPAQDYAKGALVKHADGLYIAMKAIRSGGNLRDGSGWHKLI